MSDTRWPSLSHAALRETCRTLHLYSQIVGKVRLALTPWLHHSWHATLYLTARGLSTSLIPHGDRAFDIELDLAAGATIIRVDDGGEHILPLEGASVARYHDELLAALRGLDLPVAIHGAPNEIPDAVPFRDDTRPRTLDLEAARRFFRALVQIERVFTRFRSAYLGKVSPVHLFWGSFDLAVTRFSGRPAPRHPGGIPRLPDAVTREAYSHEVASVGFWPGSGAIDYPAFYAYAYPEPPGYRDVGVEPSAAFFDRALGEYVLPYEAVRTSADPDAALLAFCQSTYAAAAAHGWDRAALECPPGVPGVPREVA